MYETGLAEAGVSGLTGADRPADLTDRQLLVRVTSRLARCADGNTDADDWFPVATRWSRARTEAARALALCAKCPVRTHCLELSMREWDGPGRYGVWGGLLEAERAAIRKEWLSGVSVSRLLDTRTAEASAASQPSAAS